VATSDKVAGAEQRAGQFARGNKPARKKNSNCDYVALRAMWEADRAALPPRMQPGGRHCLGCGALFVSVWCGNPLCKRCGEQA
jgi:hypothetical protein